MVEVNRAAADSAASGRPSTKDRLKASARRLFARNGIEGVTVRHILAEAGEKNGASLNYHFGTKEELVKAIAIDIFGLLDKAWGRAMEELDDRTSTATIRDLVTVIVNAAAVLDEGSEATSLRLIDRLTQERQHLLVVITAEHGFSSYRLIMERMAALQYDVPETAMRHRAIFLTRYLSTIMAMYEEAQTANLAAQRRLVGPVHDIGNVIDTAVGIVSAVIVDGGRAR
jgi:AcrR family transcriptional regulator